MNSRKKSTRKQSKLKSGDAIVAWSNELTTTSIAQSSSRPWQYLKFDDSANHPFVSHPQNRHNYASDGERSYRLSQKYLPHCVRHLAQLVG